MEKPVHLFFKEVSALDFKQIIAFVNLGNTLDYQLAAKKSALTVDELVKEIKNLEQELVVPLIRANGGAVELTAIGKTILPLAEQTVQGQAQLLTTVADYKKKEAQQAVKLTVLPAFANYAIAPLIEQLSQQHKMTIIEDNNPLTSLQEGQSDIAFISYPDADQLSDDIELITVGTDRLAAYVPARNPISQHSTLSLEDLKTEKFITLNHQTPFAKFVQQFCSAAGFELYSVFEGERGQTLVNMVALGMGVTLLMEQSVSNKLDSKVVKIQIEPAITQQLAFARLKDAERTPEQEALWQALKDSAKN